MTGALLGVWAHPDDEAYLSAGLMAQARREGRRVVVVTATAGEHGTGDADRWPPERLGALRRHELRSSLAALDVHEHHVLGLPDGACDAFDASGTERIAAMIADIRPATIVTFGPEGMTGHADHRAVSRWTTAAWHELGCPGDLQYATLTPEFHERWGAVNEQLGLWSGIDRPPCAGGPHRTLELTGEHLDQKLVALRAHASQTGPLLAALGEDVFREWWAWESFVPAGDARTLPVLAGGRAAALTPGTGR